jgi:Protein of unknown function (DUF3618)
VTMEHNDGIRLTEEDAHADFGTEADAGSLTDEERAEAIEIRAEIEETRDEMGGTLQELGDRLEPGHLVQQAKDNVRDATIGRVEETAKGMTEMVIDTIKSNPIPAAMAGAGLALLWMNRSDGRGRYPYTDGRAPGFSAASGYRTQGGSGIGQKVGDVAGSVGDTVGGAVGSVKGTAEEAVGTVTQSGAQAVEEVGLRVDRFMQASPLAVGAIAVGAGVLAGTMIPETRQEQKMLGDASRQIADTVRQTVDDVATKAEETLDETEQKVTAG